MKYKQINKIRDELNELTDVTMLSAAVDARYDAFEEYVEINKGKEFIHLSIFR